MTTSTYWYKHLTDGGMDIPLRKMLNDTCDYHSIPFPGRGKPQVLQCRLAAAEFIDNCSQETLVMWLTLTQQKVTAFLDGTALFLSICNLNVYATPPSKTHFNKHYYVHAPQGTSYKYLTCNPENRQDSNEVWEAVTVIEGWDNVII